MTKLWCPSAGFYLTLQLLLRVVLEVHGRNIGGFDFINKNNDGFQISILDGDTDNTEEDALPNPDDAAAVAAFWKSFKQRHTKEYESENHEHVASVNFKNNLRNVSQHNRLYATGKSSYAMRIHEYSDWALCDIKKKLQGLDEVPEIPPNARSPAPPYNGRRHFEPTKASGGEARFRRQYVLDSIDYRSYGYVTPVKNQAGALEGQYFGYYGKLINVSIQNLIDCATSAYSNFGCEGGWPMNAFDYVKAVGGIMPESAYAFKATDVGQYCKFNKASVIPKLVVTGGQYLPQGVESELMKAVYNVGPIAVAINADSPGFINYKMGVYADPYCSKQVNHAVLVVGYGTEAGGDFWLVKNSWGTDWGLNGYIKMARNKNNQCGIASFGQYPILVEPAMG